VDRWSWTISIPGTPSMVPLARTFVRAFLGGHPLVRDAELIASEYVTNTIRHTASGEGGVVHVTVAATPQSVRIEVTDHGGAVSEPTSVPVPCRSVTDDDESGRGLLIVDFLATRWGHYGVSGGQTTFWAVLGEAAEDAPTEGAGESGGGSGGDATGGAGSESGWRAPDP
jgi:anti-sigma regulatory factor (Ser/Thr protein kinase)